MAIHIAPINDIIPHPDLTTCRCKPRILWESGKMIVVHNALDGREEYEKLIAETDPITNN